MTAGNQAQTGLSEMALGLIEDERVSVLGLHIEGFDSVPGFERLAARARDLNKPIVAMKVGRSEQARAATISHTASLAGSDAGSDAFLKRLGIPRVHSIPAFLETLKLLHGVGPLAGNRLSSMSCSGGEASVMADAADGRAVTFPPLTLAHRAEIKETLGPLVAVANPLDYHTFIWNDEPAMTATFAAMVSGGFDLNMLVLDFPRTDRCSDADWWPTVRAFEAALKANSARGAIVASIAENLPEETADDLFARGIVPLHGIEEAMAAAEAAAFVGKAWRNLSSTPIAGRGGPAKPGRSGGEVSAHDPHSSSLCSAPFPLKRGEQRRPLDEASAKSLLASHGLPIPAGRRVSSTQEALAAAQTLGTPVAVKALGLAHKSEQGAVRLNLRTPVEIEAAATELLPLGTGIYVERMIEGAVAELIVGVTPDPVFGALLTVGSGGVLVELLADTATLLLPATRDEIEKALRFLKLFPLLDGYRGRPKGDVAAAIDTILAISDFVVENADRIVELDINPLIVCEQGAFIADALLVGDFETLEESA
jgi:acetate---CoA ligase (ADP-forming)